MRGFVAQIIPDSAALHPGYLARCTGLPMMKGLPDNVKAGLTSKLKRRANPVRLNAFLGSTFCKSSNNSGDKTKCRNQ